MLVKFNGWRFQSRRQVSLSIRQPKKFRWPIIWSITRRRGACRINGSDSTSRLRTFENHWNNFSSCSSSLQRFASYIAKVVKKNLETLKWNVLPHLPYSQDISGSLFSQNSKIFHKFGSPQKSSHFSRWYSKIAWEMERSRGQLWIIL